MLYGHHVACGQTERSVITLGSARPVSKGDSPSETSLEVAICTELCMWGWHTGRTDFSKRGSAGSEGAHEGWAALEMIYRAWRTSDWRDPGGSWLALVPGKGNWNGGITLGILHQRFSNFREFAWEGDLGGCTLGESASVPLASWQEICIFKVSQVTFFFLEKGPQSPLWETLLQNSRWTPGREWWMRSGAAWHIYQREEESGEPSDGFKDSQAEGRLEGIDHPCKQ